MATRVRTEDRTASATIRDVAARAGVGMATVSRVLNDHPSVTNATRAKVLDAVTELHYRPSRVAQALSRRRTGTIAVVCPLITLPSAVERLRGVITAAAPSEYELILHNLDPSNRNPARFARVARRDLADGMLLVSISPTADEVASLHSAHLPAVVVDGDTDELCSVMVDDVEGGRLAARHLWGLGHRRIAYIGDDVDDTSGFTSSEHRRQGLLAELADHGVDVDPSLLRQGPHGFEAAYSSARALLELRDPPTAIFAHSDTQALAVLQAAAELGVGVPEQLSVLGFDDIDVARFAGLSTIRQPLTHSGELGMQFLMVGLLTGSLHPTRHLLPLEVITRRTTGPAPERAQRSPRRRSA